MTRVPLSSRLYYGAGSVAFGVKDNGFAYFLLIYYNQVLGLSPSLAAIAQMVALVWDAISDPLVGWVSDHWHSRWGRRHPFMYFAALPLAVAYAFLWNPPSGLTEGQATSGLGVLLAGVLIEAIELPRGATPGEVDPSVVRNLGILLGPALLIFWFVALAFVSRYRIDRRGHTEHLEVLAQRAVATEVE